MQIAERAKKYRDTALTNLHNFIDRGMLEECSDSLNKRGASGVDNQTWHQYNEIRSERIPELLNGFKSGKYRAPHIRRAYIPKGDGKQRPLGLPTVEDKILQTAVNRVLTTIYEQIFYDTSYGFRPGRSQHQTLERLFKEVSMHGKHYVIDADMQNYFGSSTMIRYADDFLLVFSNREDAMRVMKMLPKRLGKYGLRMHPDKTKLIELTGSKENKQVTFDFLGFTHYMGKSRKGNKVLKRKTSSKKLKMSVKRIGEWIKFNRHRPVRELITLLNLKLKGHYAYYGISFNSRSLGVFYEIVKRLLYKWLKRRGGRSTLKRPQFDRLITEWVPLARPKIYHKYALAKP